MVDVPAAPALATISGVELCSVGYWDISNADDWHPSAEELAAAVAALDCPAVRRPCLKFGHTGTPGEGDPSIGVIDNLRLTEDGQTLVGDFVGVPGWFAEADDQGRSVIASAYPDRSGEFYRDFVCQLGHVHPFVVGAVALLGVERPGVGTLESIYDLYAKAPLKEVAVAKSSAALAGTTTDEVRKAYYNSPEGDDWMLWIREMYVEPPELIVQNDRDDSLLRVPYTVGADGEVEFGEGQAVKVEYVAARAKAEKPAIAFASRTEARPQKASDSTTSADPAGKKKEGAVPDLNSKEGLAQLLDLPVDADDEAVNKALADALDAKKKAAEGETGDVAANLDPEANPPADSDLSLDTVAAAARKLGLTVLDSETAAKLTADAAAGREALSRIQRDEDTKIVKAAVNDGKIPPSREAHYVELMSRDREGTTKFLAEAPREAAVPLTEVGHSTDVDAATGASNPKLKEWSF